MVAVAVEAARFPLCVSGGAGDELAAARNGRGDARAGLVMVAAAGSVGRRGDTIGAIGASHSFGAVVSEGGTDRGAVGALAWSASVFASAVSDLAGAGATVVLKRGRSGGGAECEPELDDAGAAAAVAAVAQRGAERGAPEDGAAAPDVLMDGKGADGMVGARRSVRARGDR